MGLNIGDLEARITKGKERIAKAKALGMQVSDWESYLKGLEKEYEVAVKEPKAIAFQTKNDFHIFTNHTLPQVQEWLLERTLEEIKQTYLPDTYQWIEAHRPDLEIELQELEAKLESYVLSSTNFNEFKLLLQSYWNWHVKAVQLYKLHVQKVGLKELFHLQNPEQQGGEKYIMSFDIETEDPIEAGLYEMTIDKVDMKESKFGPTLQVTFKLEDSRSLNSLFPLPAKLSNKTGLLFKKALGEFKKANSEELIGKKVKALVEHVQRDGRTYVNVSKIL